MQLTRRTLLILVAIACVAAACGSPSVDAAGIPPLGATTPDAVRMRLERSTRPVVINVWASWCAPCRSEAPLLRAAHSEYGDSVDFIGIDVRDTQEGARSFIAEFGLDGFDHLFDTTGAVPDSLGGFGVPITFFFRPGGELDHMHSGVIDERALALQVDELLMARG